MAVIAILTAGIIPYVKTQVRRQREQQLREELRDMREAIKEFHRDTAGSPCGAVQGSAIGQSGTIVNGGGIINNPQLSGGAGASSGFGPPSLVVITDCTLFGVDNPDRYPPKLETLVEGVTVKARQRQGLPLGTGANPADNNQLGSSDVTDKKKVYLRAIPIDPMTGKADWELRSCYDSAEAASWGGENVFDVHSKSQETALDGTKYSDW